MNPAHLPTEAQCLAMSACTIAKDLLDTIAQLPFLASEQAGQGAPLADLAHAHARMLRLARNGGPRVHTQRDRDSVQITTLF